MAGVRFFNAAALSGARADDELLRAGAPDMTSVRHDAAKSVTQHLAIGFIAS